MICGAAARRHFLLRAAALFDFNERIPMTDIIDIHTHSIASMHAYSTIREIATMAKEKGLDNLEVKALLAHTNLNSG